MVLKATPATTHTTSAKQRPQAPALAKREIRDQLERRFGYSFATVRADIEGLAGYVRRWPSEALLTN